MYTLLFKNYQYIKGGRTPPTQLFLLMLLCMITIIVYLQGLLHYNTRTKCLTNFRVNLEEISRASYKTLLHFFWSGVVSWSSAIWCTTSQADTLLQDNESFSISILLYDLFAFFIFIRYWKFQVVAQFIFLGFLGTWYEFSLLKKCLPDILRTHVELLAAASYKFYIQ